MSDHAYAPRRIVPSYEEENIRSNRHDTGCAKCGGSPLGHGIRTNTKLAWYWAGGILATIAGTAGFLIWRA